MRRLPELARRRLAAWTGPPLAPPSPQELQTLRPQLDEETFALVAELAGSADADADWFETIRSHLGEETLARVAEAILTQGPPQDGA